MCAVDPIVWPPVRKIVPPPDNNNNRSQISKISSGTGTVGVNDGVQRALVNTIVARAAPRDQHA